MADIVKRTTVIVRDAERAARWYEQVFGMSRWMDTPFTLSGTQLAAGKKGDRTRLIIMKAEHDVIGMIGLLQWVEPERDFPPLPIEVLPGMPIFVVAVDDCAACVDRAGALGSHIHCEPHLWEVTGADGLVKSMIGAGLFDLDGHFFEINQVVG